MAGTTLEQLLPVLEQLSSEGIFIVCDEEIAGHVDSSDLYSPLVDVLCSLKLLVLSYKREIVRPCALFFSNNVSARTQVSPEEGYHHQGIFYISVCLRS